MESIQKSKLKMYITVRDYLAQFLTILTALPNFTALYTALKNIIELIEKADKEQSVKNSGNVDEKKTLTEQLVALTLDTANKIFAYASFSKNSLLKGRATFTLSELKKMGPTNLCSTAQKVHDLGQANITALEPYLVTPASQTVLQAAITALETAVGKPRIATSETNLATQQVTDYLKSGLATLEDLDTLLEIIRLTQPDFYFGYKVVRKPIPVNGSPYSIVGVVTDAATKTPIQKALLTFTLNSSSNSGKTTFTKKSAKQGGFRVSNAAQGTYAVTIELPGYKTKETTVSVVSGLRSTMDIALEKA
jgi:hypothetical protein